VTPLVVFVLTSSQPAVHSSSADVLLNRQAFVISGLRDSTFWYPNRAQLTQASLARLPEVAQRVVDAAGLADRGRYGFLAQSWVAAGGGTDVMTFHVSDRDPELATRLATMYAEEYIAYRRELDTRSVTRAIAVLGRQLERARGTDPVAFADLVSKQQQLHTALASMKTNAVLVRPAGVAEQVAPTPYDSLLDAVLLGLVVGIGLAALALLLDPRGRTAEAIAEQVALPLLGVLPSRRRARRRRTGLAMRGHEERRADAVRRLRTTLELGSLGSRRDVMLVTSAVAADGKSTTAADLAVAFAQAGRNVVLVDLNLRGPTLDRLLGQPLAPGVTDVLGRTATLDDALRSVPLDGSRSDDQEPAATGGAPGTLRLVTAGASIARDETPITDARAIHEMLGSLREAAELVIVDTPPLLQSSDLVALSTSADGVLLVLDALRYRRRYAAELRHLLALSTAPPLGIVVVCEPGSLRYSRVHVDQDRSLPRRLQALGRA
jgi:Mrp family chromosome partitioning ATPase